MNRLTTSSAKKTGLGLLAACVFAIATAGSSPAQEQRPIGTVRIQSVKLHHNVYSGGKKGLRINVELEAHDLKGRKLSTAAFFHFRNGSALKDYDNKYRSSKGNVATWKFATPRYNRARLTMKLFLPNEQLHINSAGNYDLQFYVTVDEMVSGEESANWPRLARSLNQYLTYSKPLREVAQSPFAPRIADTRWQGRETLAGYGKLSFRLNDNGEATMIDTSGSHMGTWRQNGTSVALEFFNGDVVYTGRVEGNRIFGQASNGSGKKWVFEVERQ